MARRNKKGSVQDIIYIMVFLVVVFIGTLVAYKISNEINTKFQASDDISAKGKTAMSSINDMYPNVVDNSFLLLTIGLCIVALALASMVRIHPVFFVFFIIIMVIIVFLAGVFSNIYQKIASNTEMEELADNMTFMTYIMRYLPFITGLMGFVLSFVMYKTWQNA